MGILPMRFHGLEARATVAVGTTALPLNILALTCLGRARGGNFPQARHGGRALLVHSCKNRQKRVVLRAKMCIQGGK